jgi:hypothetical protein
MKRTIGEIRYNMERVGCDNETALELCAEVERLEAIVERLPKDESGEPIAPGDVLYDGYESKQPGVKVTGFDTRDGKLTCLLFGDGFDRICSGYYHDREAAEKARGA